MRSEAARLREVWRYFPRSMQAAIKDLSPEIAPDDAFLPPHHHPTHSIDPALTCIAQLCTLRLHSDSAFVSLLDDRRQYILAEATPTSHLQPTAPTDRKPRPDEFWLGAVSVPRGKLTCGILMDQAEDIASRTESLVIDDLAQHPAFKSSQLLREPDAKRAYAGVPLRSKKGFAIGVLCVYFKSPLRPDAAPLDIGLLQELALVAVDILDSRSSQEESQRIETMTKGLVKFVDDVILPTSAQHYQDDNPVLRTSSSSAEIPSPPKTPSDTPSAASPTPPASKDKTDPSKDDLGSSKDGTRPPMTPQRSSSSQITARQQRGSEDQPADISIMNKSSGSLITPGHENVDGGQGKVSATMQDILPHQGGAMFTRAARIWRHSSELDGVVIFDASIAALNQPRVPQVLGSADGTFGPSTGATMRSAKSATSFDFGKERERSSSSDTAKSNNSESKTQQTCRILGFSRSIASDNADDAAPPAYLACPESTLRRMLRRYPKGRIVNYGLDGRPSSDDSDQSRAGQGSPVAQSPKNKRSDKIMDTLESVRKIAAGATSLAFIPLWDYQRQRYFACCFCWTTQIYRVLSPRLDLVFFKAFGNSIMTELSRLDATTSDVAKTSFVASISHELRSPLHGILGATEFLTDTTLDSFQANMLHTIATSGRTLLDTLNHVMDYSKMNQYFDNRPRSTIQFMDVGHLRLTAQSRKRRDQLFHLNDLTSSVDLSKLAEEVVEAVYASHSYRIFSDNGVDDDNGMNQLTRGLQRRNSTVLSDAASTIVSMAESKDGGLDDSSRLPDVSVSYRASGRKIVRVILDIDKADDWSFTIAAGVWRRLIMNLFGNALKFTDSGSVRITLSATKSALGLSSRETQITLTIHDTGPGMTSDFLVNNLFSAFRQEDSFSAGIGLGMHIVRQLIETISGQIDIKTQPSLGTDVIVKLKLPDGKASVLSEVDLAEPLDPLRGKKAYILDISSAILTELYADETSHEMIAKREAALAVRNCLQHTLADWYDMEVTTGETWKDYEVDYVICTESSFYQLAEITRYIEGRAEAPIVIFIAVDALEATALRNDVRVQSDHFVCGIIVQPLGPLKLKEVLGQCWQRREERAERIRLGIGLRPPLGSSYHPAMSITTGGTPDFLPDDTKGNAATTTATGPPRRPAFGKFDSRQSIFQVLDNGTSLVRAASPTSTIPASPGPSTPGPIASPLTSLRTPPLTTANIAQADFSSEGRTVLITDDNAINRRLLAAFMTKHKIPYAEAANGQIAVNLYRQFPGRYYIILMDLSMPVMDGMTATRHIRDVERDRNSHSKPSLVEGAPTTPPTSPEAMSDPALKSRVLIVALTGLTSEATRKEALDSGIDHYLTKPVDFAVLLAWIKVGSELVRGRNMSVKGGDGSSAVESKRKAARSRRRILARLNTGMEGEATGGAAGDGDDDEDDS